MGNTYEEIDQDPPEPEYDFYWDDDVAVEIWPAYLSSFQVTVTCKVRRARWWQWWRSDLPFPHRKQKAINDALMHARAWLRKRDQFVPASWELTVVFAKSE